MTLSDRQMRIIRSAREWVTQYGEAGYAAGAADALACCAGERGLACGPLSRWWGVRAEFCSLSRAGGVRLRVEVRAKTAGMGLEKGGGPGRAG